MKSKTKKIFLLLALLVVPFITTGCGKNGSAKDVAVEMVTKLSKDDYKDIGDIFYQEKDSYFDETAFKAAIQDKKLNISGNKTIKVKEVGSEITDQETGYVKVDVYRVNNVIEGKYNVSVKTKSSKEIKDVVYTYGETVKSSNNYDYDTDYSDKTKSYTFKLSVEDKGVDSFVKTYLDTIYSNATTGTFEDVKKFFDEDCEDYDDIKTYYGKLESKSKKTDSTYSYMSDFEIEDFEQKATYYYNDDNIVVMFEYELQYKNNYVSTNNSYDRTYDVKTILVLKKDSKGNYVITNGNNMFIY